MSKHNLKNPLIIDGKKYVSAELVEDLKVATQDLLDAGYNSTVFAMPMKAAINQLTKEGK